MRMGFAVLAGAAALVAVPLAVADANFTDPAGDANGAPDVVAVVVANDSKNRVAFEIELAGDQRLPDDGEIALMIDTDKNPETGRGGWDYFVIVASDESSMLRRWDGTQWVDAPSTTARAWVIGGYVQYSIDRSELGNSAAFDFHRRLCQGHERRGRRHRSGAGRELVLVLYHRREDVRDRGHASRRQADASGCEHQSPRELHHGADGLAGATVGIEVDVRRWAASGSLRASERSSASPAARRSDCRRTAKESC